MASFQSKIGRKRPRKNKNKNYLCVPFLPDAEQKIPKQQQKIKKIKKNTIMNSFQTKISGKMMKKRENKNFNFVPFLPDA